MSHVNTVTISLAEYEELRVLKENYGKLKILTVKYDSVGKFFVKDNYERARQDIIIQADQTTDGRFNINFSVKSMRVGDKFLIEKTH